MTTSREYHEIRDDFAWQMAEHLAMHYDASLQKDSLHLDSIIQGPNKQCTMRTLYHYIQKVVDREIAHVFQLPWPTA